MRPTKTLLSLPRALWIILEPVLTLALNLLFHKVAFAHNNHDGAQNNKSKEWFPERKRNICFTVEAGV